MRAFGIDFGGVQVDACWPAFLAWGREVLGPVEGASIGSDRRLGKLLAYFCWGRSRRLRNGRIRNVVERLEKVVKFTIDTAVALDCET